VLALRETLSREAGERTLLLPRILPVRDIETLFPTPPEVPEAMSRWQQRLQLARLVHQFERRATGLLLSAAQVLALTDALMDLHAALVRERAAPLGANAGLDALPAIEGKGAEHWRRRADFLNILFQHWPQYEAETALRRPSAKAVCCGRWRSIWRRNHPPRRSISLARPAAFPPCVS
jgi:inactivated superfamily I helicase